MTFPAAAGFRDIAAPNMAYVPEIWSPKILIKFYANTVLKDITNTDYEGEIKKQGSEVKIRTKPTITIRPYSKGQTTINETPTSAPVFLKIDNGYYWSFVTDKVDDAQTDIKNYTELWTDDAAEQLGITVDTAELGRIYTQVAATNQGNLAGAKSAKFDLGAPGTPLKITKQNVIEVFQDMASVMTEANIPIKDRFVVAPAWLTNLIGKSDLKSASLSGDNVSLARTNDWGEIGRFKILESNLLTDTADISGHTTTEIIFGTKYGTTFASQILENESLPNPFGFGQLFRGLHVYGCDVVKPDAVGWLHAYPG